MTSFAGWRRDPLAVLDAVVAGLGGEDRPGQRALARAVVEAIEGGHHLVAQAPTGAGKSLGYLAPAVASGQRVVVSTATIALQDQLVGKDLPDVARHSGVDVSYARLKGRSNYVCLAKLRAAHRPGALFEERVGPDFESELAAVAAFAESSTAGDRSELGHDVSDATWRATSCGADECPGRARCSDGDECFAELARERAFDVQVLVVNHSLYCVHLQTGGQLLPDHDLVVLDEAHAFAARATTAFGAELAVASLAPLARQLSHAGAEDPTVRGLERAASGLHAVLSAREGTVGRDDDELRGALTNVAEQLAAARGQLRDADDDASRRAVQAADARLRTVRRLADPGTDDVVWLERGRSPRLRLAPVTVAPQLAATLFGRRPVVAVSATLGGTPPFDAVVRALGLEPGAPIGAEAARRVDEPPDGRDDGDEHAVEDDEDGNGDGRARGPGTGYEAIAVDSPFDWRAQGMLYVARDLPPPTAGDDAWLEPAGGRLLELVRAAGGRTLVLCTSVAKVRHFTDLLRAETDVTVLAQGDAANARLVDRFRADEHSVLVGTRSFFEGVDVPGSACVLVVLDRLPFTTPADPLARARKDRVAAAGGDPFAAIDLPEAALVLAQGVGRLIRRTDDRGVVAVLDSRLATRAYRRTLLAGVPPLRRSVDTAEVTEFLRAAAAS